MGRLPEPVAYGVARAVARLMALRGGATLAMSERHMRRVLASECVDGVEPDPALVRRLSRRTFAYYARYWAEGARLPYERRRACGGTLRLESGRRAPADGHGPRDAAS